MTKEFVDAEALFEETTQYVEEPKLSAEFGTPTAKQESKMSACLNVCELEILGTQKNVVEL